jgi:lipopolysaccharide export system permease protein
MGTLSRHLSRRLGATVATVLAGLVAMVQTLDLMKNGDEVIARHGSGWSALAFYAFLRLPVIVTLVFLFAVLLGALLEFTRLVLNGEALAMRGAGISIWGLLLRFLPAALTLGAFGFVLQAYMAPWASRSLARWDSARDPHRAIADGAEWLRDGASLVRIGRISDDRRLLGDVSIFRLNHEGLLAEDIEADAARFDHGLWTLERVQIFPATPGRYVTLSQMKWSTGLRPRHLASLSLPPQSMSFASLEEQLTGHAPTTEPARLYVLEMLRRIRVPALVQLMILLAAPLLMELERFGGIAREFGFAAALGFGYFVIDGMAQSLGAAGWLPSLIAVCAAPAIFAALGVARLPVARG